jgi:8-oxo-dGTP diphosphatase
MADTRYTVNVDVAVRSASAGGEPAYLFIVRGEDEDHAAGTVGFPGGTMEADPGEAGVITATARREIREEVGVEITEPDVVTSTTFELDMGRTCLNLILTADVADGEAHVADPEEVSAVEWRTPARVFGDEETPPWTEQSLQAVLDHRQG